MFDPKSMEMMTSSRNPSVPSDDVRQLKSRVTALEAELNGLKLTVEAMRVELGRRPHPEDRPSTSWAPFPAASHAGAFRLRPNFLSLRGEPEDPLKPIRIHEPGRKSESDELEESGFDSAPSGLQSTSI
jgi:hypothetical protein